MLVGEDGMLLGLLVPSLAIFAERPEATGGKPEGSPAYGSFTARVVGLSGLVPCLEGLVGVAFGTLSVAEAVVEDINGEGEFIGDAEIAGDADEAGRVVCFASEKRFGDGTVGGGVKDLDGALDVADIVAYDTGGVLRLSLRGQLWY